MSTTTVAESIEDAIAHKRTLDTQERQRQAKRRATIPTREPIDHSIVNISETGVRTCTCSEQFTSENQWKEHLLARRNISAISSIISDQSQAIDEINEFEKDIATNSFINPNSTEESDERPHFETEPNVEMDVIMSSNDDEEEEGEEALQISNDSGITKSTGTCQICGAASSGRTLCAKHRKQKSRGTLGKPAQKGKPKKALKDVRNPRAKLSQFGKMVTTWTGSVEETEALVSAFHNKLHKETSIYEKIGKSMCDFIASLPRLSPYRQSLIQAMSSGSSCKELMSVLPLKRSAVSAAINLDSNILKETKYKTNVTRNRVQRNVDNQPEMMGMQSDSVPPEHMLQHIHHHMPPNHHELIETTNHTMISNIT